MEPTGVLRFPAFIRGVLLSIRDQQQYRTDESPPVMNPAMTTDSIMAIVIFAICFLVLRIVLENSFFDMFFSAYGTKLRRKISENFFYSMYYTAAFSYFLFWLWPRVDWGVNLLTNKWVVKKLLHPLPPPMIFEEHAYYTMSAGFYVSASVFIMMYDAKRSDFQQLILHHVVTLCLILISYAYGYVRCGILILGIHDLADVLLYSAKFVHHLGFKGIDTAIFSIFAVVFYFSRLLLYPRISYTVIVETLQLLVAEPPFNRWAMFYDTYLLHHLVFFILLGTLQVLQCFWFALILKMVHRELFLGIKISDEGDIRSDDEDEKD